MGIRVFLADDHRLMLVGLRSALGAYDIEVVGEACSIDVVKTAFVQSRADVLVIDIRFNGANQNGLDICREILVAQPTAKIVVFSQFDDPWVIEKTYKLGAFAFVRKDEDTKILVKAIEAAYRCEEFLSPVVAQLLAQAMIKPENPIHLLDEKEMRLFVLVAEGASLVEIASTIGLSYKTVSTSVKHIKEKLNIASSADFTKLAIKYGLISLEVERKQDGGARERG